MFIYSFNASGDLTAEAPGALAALQIVGQPVDQLVSAGDFASFSVVVGNTSGVTFQWAFNGTDIAGADGDSLLLPAVSAANVGRYSVTVTNSAGSVTSSPATLALDLGVSAPPSWRNFVGRFSSAQDSLLSLHAITDGWMLAELHADGFEYNAAGDTVAFGHINDGRPLWIGDFSGAGRSQVLFYSPGDDNWWLGSLDAAGALQWSLVGNTAAAFGHGFSVGRLFWIGDFSGAGRSQVLFYSQYDDNWWLGAVDTAGALQWSLVGNTAVQPGHGFFIGPLIWIGEFTGTGRSQVLTYYGGDNNWWLGSVDTAGALQWSLVGNTAGFGGLHDGRPFWIGEFTGAGRSQVLFYYPGDDNWWLGSVDAALMLRWSLVGNTAAQFGHGFSTGRPFWIGDFTGAGRTQLLYYSPPDDNWWLGSVDAALTLQWSLVGNTAGFGGLHDSRPFWIGDFAGAGRSQVLFYDPGDFNWWLGSVNAAGQLRWSLVGNTAG